MKEYRVYTKHLAEYLTRLGFEIIDIVPNVLKPQFKNWIFYDSPELQNAISQYTQARRK